VNGSRRVMQYSLPEGPRIVVQLGIISHPCSTEQFMASLLGYHVVASEVEVGAA